MAFDFHVRCPLFPLGSPPFVRLQRFYTDPRERTDRQGQNHPPHQNPNTSGLHEASSITYIIAAKEKHKSSRTEARKESRIPSSTGVWPVQSRIPGHTVTSISPFQQTSFTSKNATADAKKEKKETEKARLQNQGYPGGPGVGSGRFVALVASKHRYTIVLEDRWSAAEPGHVRGAGRRTSVESRGVRHTAKTRGVGGIGNGSRETRGCSYILIRHRRSSRVRGRLVVSRGRRFVR